MIILDTNILSAVMRAAIDPPVQRWLDGQAAELVWTTSITVFEIHFGLRLLPPGRRRERLEGAFLRAVADVLGGRIMIFDGQAAEVAGAIAAEQQRAGRVVEIRDVQIAGITEAQRVTLATRNIRHFEGLGITLINPWTA